MLKEIRILLLLPVLVLCGVSIAESGVPMDFDGDGKTDPTVVIGENIGNQTFREYWHVLGSRVGYFSTQWGGNKLTSDGFVDNFVPADYDGDGKTDFAVYRVSGDLNYPNPPGTQSYFYIFYSATNTYAGIPWGRSVTTSYQDEPVPQDYDGDGKADLAVYRHGQGISYWWILQSSDGNLRGEIFGNNSDLPLRGDFDGDGKADLAVWRTSNFTTNAAYIFNIRHSLDGTIRTATLGRVIADFIVPGDYDGDGKSDLALFGGKSPEFSDGYWKWIRSRDGQTVFYKFGYATDGAVPGDYDGDGTTDVAVYRINRFAECNVPSYFFINRSSSGLQVTQFGSCHSPLSY